MQTTIYVLELAEGNYYVGKTTNLQQRFQNHLDGRGSAWTKLYKPLNIAESFIGDDFDEDKTVLKYMSEHGIDKVRGGSYCTIKLSADDYAHLNKKLLSTSDRCYRCHRPGHFANKCYAKRTLSGKFINESAKNTPRYKNNASNGESSEIIEDSENKDIESMTVVEPPTYPNAMLNDIGELVTTAGEFISTVGTLITKWW